MSEYCHRQLKTENTWKLEDWIKKGYELLSEVESYLWEISVIEAYGWVSKPSLTSDLQELRESFINDSNMTEQQLEIRMQLIKPALDFRRDNRIDILSDNKQLRTQKPASK